MLVFAHFEASKDIGRCKYDFPSDVLGVQAQARCWREIERHCDVMLQEDRMKIEESALTLSEKDHTNLGGVLRSSGSDKGENTHII